MALSGRVAVVTGAAMGIGRAAAVRLARDGADVAVMDKAGAELKETALLIEAQGRRSLAIEVDLCEPEDIAHAVSFFASDGARYVTGTSLLVNGGRVMI